jgi:hypothetical protein
MEGKNEEKDKICIKVYLGKGDFSSICQDANESGFRHGGLQERVKNIQGPAGREHWNTDGISKFLKHCWHDWREHRAEREEKEKARSQRERELRAELAALEKGRG